MKFNILTPSPGITASLVFIITTLKGPLKEEIRNRILRNLYIKIILRKRDRERQNVLAMSSFGVSLFLCVFDKTYRKAEANIVSILAFNFVCVELSSAGPLVVIFITSLF
jgi:hypothetical protein